MTKLTKPQEKLLAQVHAEGKVPVTGSRYLTAMILQGEGLVKVRGETHGGEPCVPYAPPHGERWHWVVTLP